MTQLSLTGTPVRNAAPAESTKQEKTIRASAKKKQGSIYVASGGWHQADEHYTPETLQRISESYYGSSLLLKLSNLILPSTPEIKGIKPDGNEDELLSKELMALSESPGVRLYEKMRFAMQDICWAGFGVFNDTWDYDGTTFTLQELRRLPPESFNLSGTTSDYIDPVFSGVCITDDKPQFWHTNLDGTKQIIEPFYLFAPNSKDIAGTPLIRPIIPVIQFAQQGLFAMQQTVSRSGAPWAFIKLLDQYSDDDLAYADKILANWGKDSMYKLLPNMEFVCPPLPEPKTPEAAVNLLAKMMIEYFSPASFIQNDAAAISSSDAGALQLFNSWIISMQNYLEDAFERLLQQYVDGNLYRDYHVEITLPRPQEDKTTQLLALLDGFNKASIATDEEMRALFPDYLKEMTPEEMLAFQSEKKARQPVQANPFGQAQPEMVGNAHIAQMLKESLKV